MTITFATPSRRQILAGLSAAAAFGAAPAAVQAQAAPSMPHLRRGIGVHNLLNWPDTSGEGASLRYDWPPFATPAFAMSQAAIVALRTAGFDFVRLTVDPSIFIVETGLAHRTLLEHHAVETVRRFLDAGLSVVFDLHPISLNPAYDPAALVDPSHPEPFARYVDMVSRIAASLRGLPPDRVVIEPFNEPPLEDRAQAHQWQSQLERLHRAIRVADPLRPVVLNGLHWDSIDGLLALDTAPFRNSAVLYTFHCYDPHGFTHQGVQPDTRWLSGLRWPEDTGNIARVEAAALVAIAADGKLTPAERAEADQTTRYYAADMRKEPVGSARIARDFDSVTAWARDHGISTGQILLGEFGCVADPVSPAADRLAWLTAVRSAAEADGFAWAYWAYKGNSGMSLLDAHGGLDAPTLQALGLAPRP